MAGYQRDLSGAVFDKTPLNVSLSAISGFLTCWVSYKSEDSAENYSVCHFMTNLNVYTHNITSTVLY